MTNFPAFGPFGMASAPLGSTIVVVGTPALMAALVLGLGVLAGVVCAVMLRTRRGRGRVAAPGRSRGSQAAMPFASAGQAR
jgi:hypothetical protein